MGIYLRCLEGDNTPDNLPGAGGRNFHAETKVGDVYTMVFNHSETVKFKFQVESSPCESSGYGPSVKWTVTRSWIEK